MVSARKVEDEQPEHSVTDEIDEIRRRHRGLAAPKDLVSYAESHPDSILYARFQWDNSIAGHEHRLWQAREILQQYWTVSRVERKPVRMYLSMKSDRSPKGGYRHSDDVLSSPELRAEWRQMAIDELALWRARYEALTELAPVFRAIARITKQYEDGS